MIYRHIICISFETNDSFSFTWKKTHDHRNVQDIEGWPNEHSCLQTLWCLLDVYQYMVIYYIIITYIIIVSTFHTWVRTRSWCSDCRACVICLILISVSCNFGLIIDYIMILNKKSSNFCFIWCTHTRDVVDIIMHNFDNAWISCMTKLGLWIIYK